MKIHVPDDGFALLDLEYNDDSDAVLDVYYPSKNLKDLTLLPLIVWVHGGGRVSVKKEQVRNYAKILSSNCYIVAAINYSIAPEEKYPAPVIQTNKALKFLVENSHNYQINKNGTVPQSV